MEGLAKQPSRPTANHFSLYGVTALSEDAEDILGLHITTAPTQTIETEFEAYLQEPPGMIPDVLQYWEVRHY
jgi:hypothetical protein